MEVPNRVALRSQGRLIINSSQRYLCNFFFVCIILFPFSHPPPPRADA